MTYDPERHHRRSIRARGYDYGGSGAYFVTICTHERASLFGDVAEAAMAMNDLGRIVEEEWFRSAEIRHEVALDEFIVMPNHIHGIVFIVAPETAIGTADGARLQRPKRSLGSFVAGFKAATTKRINALRDLPGTPVWLRNYHDHIIRNDAALFRIRDYIAANPHQWHLDQENPARWQNQS